MNAINTLDRQTRERRILTAALLAALANACSSHAAHSGAAGPSAPVGSDAPRAIASLAAAEAPRLIELRRDLHRHPELAGHEIRTSGLVAQHLEALGLE